jgi:hypothetical protein
MTLQAEYVPSSPLQSRGSKVLVQRFPLDTPARLHIASSQISRPLPGVRPLLRWRTIRKEIGENNRFRPGEHHFDVVVRADDAKAFDCHLKLNWILLTQPCRYSI